MKIQNRKTYKNTLARLVIVIILFVAITGLFVIGVFDPLSNNARAKQIEQQYLSMAVPPKTEIIGSASFCGNTTGTGNHVEIWAGMLIHTELSDEEIRRYFTENETIWDISRENDTSVFGLGGANAAAQQLFELAESNDVLSGRYIIGDTYPARTQIDIRGH